MQAFVSDTDDVERFNKNFADFPLSDEEKLLEDKIAEFKAKSKEIREVHGGGDLVRECETKRGCARWLLARDGNVDKAVKMLHEAILYREEHKMDHMLDQPFPLTSVIKPHYAHCWHKRDKEGRPVYFELVGQLDVHKILGVASSDEVLSYHLHFTEFFRKRLLNKASEVTGKRVDQICTVVDLNGLGMKHLSKSVYDFVTSMSRVDQLIYPEILGQFYIINTPFIFSMAWKMVKPLLEERTKSKIHIIRGDGRKELIEAIGAQNLPPAYGGTCEECEGGCLTNSVELQAYLELARVGAKAQREQRDGKEINIQGQEQAEKGRLESVLHASEPALDAADAQGDEDSIDGGIRGLTIHE